MNLENFFNVLRPRVKIGGLEINDFNLRFVIVQKDKIFSTSLKIPKGIIEDGKIKDKDNFKKALINLHSQIISRKGKKIYVIVNMADTNIYTEVFALPVVATDNLETAARLNLQMISPTEFSSVYSDWQKVGESQIDGLQLELLGAFISGQIVDDFTECLKETNFIVVAIEFLGLAIGRLASTIKNSKESFLLLRMDNFGLSFNLIKNQNLYFNHFIPWSAGEERQISLSALKTIIIQELQKVLNFASGRWPETQTSTLLLAAPALEDKISQIIQENFSLTVEKMVLPAKISSPEGWSINNNQLSQLSSDWFGALGSALRGLIPRSKDVIISLTGMGTEEEFRQQQIISFLKLWRNIVLTVVIFMAVVFGGTDFFLVKTTDSLNKQLANLSNTPELSQISELQAEAKKFNSQIDVALKAKSQASAWSPFLEKMKNLAGAEIEIDRIFIQSPDLPILFNGQTADESSIIDFKNKLEQDPAYGDVNIPLSTITPVAGGKFQFTLTFKIKQ